MDYSTVAALSVHKNFNDIVTRDFIHLCKAMRQMEFRLQSAMDQIVAVGNRKGYVHDGMEIHNANFVSCGIVTGILQSADAIFESVNLDYPLDFFLYKKLEKFISFVKKAEQAVEDYYSHMAFPRDLTFKCKWENLHKVKSHMARFEYDYIEKQGIYGGLVTTSTFWMSMMREEYARIHGNPNSSGEYGFNMLEPDWKILDIKG